MRTYFGKGLSVLLATLLAMSLSASMEYLQMYLPMRTSSNADILANGVGALAGALLMVSIDGRAWLVRVTQWRIGLFRQGAGVDFGLALVMMWMFAQINPSLPMLGNVFITEPAFRMLVAEPEQPFNLWESLAVALNLLMVGALLLSLLRIRRNVALGIGAAAQHGGTGEIYCGGIVAKILGAAAVAEWRSDSGHRDRRVADYRRCMAAAFATGPGNRAGGADLCGAVVLGAGQRYAVCRNAPVPVAIWAFGQLQQIVAFGVVGLSVVAGRIPVVGANFV